jgi:tetratricopeptide (TPR) repeat protein
VISFKRFILVYIVLSPFLFFAQKTGKGFYLLDSVNTEKLSKYDKRWLDSLLVIYHRQTADTMKVAIVRLISENLFDQTLWPRYNRLLFQTLEGKTDRFSNIQRGYAYNNFGYEAQYIKNDLYTAKKNYYDALKIFEEYGEMGGYGAEVNNLAYIYQHEGNIEEAIRLYSKALKVFEKSNNPKGLATEYLNLGDIYLSNKDHLKAEEYFKKALIYAKQKGSNSSANVEANIYNQLGAIARLKGDSKAAYDYLNKAITGYDSLGDKGKLALVISNLGEQYSTDKDLKKAEEKFLLAKKYAIEVGDNHILSRIYNILGDFYLQNNELKKAGNHSDSAYFYSKQIGYPEMILRSSRRLSDLAFKKNDPALAYAYLKEAYIMRDSIYNDNVRKATIQAQYKTEYEIKEIQKDEQRKGEKRRQELITYVVIFAFIAMCVVAYVVYRNYRDKKRSASILEDMNHLIFEQKKTVEEKQKEVLDSIRYAKRIQQSLLASEKYIQRNIERLKSKE